MRKRPVLKWVLIITAVGLIGAGVDLGVQAATTNSTAFSAVREQCVMQSSGDMFCGVKLTSLTNGTIFHQTLLVPASGGAILNLDNGHTVAASVPAGIQSTCGQCGAAMDTALSTAQSALTP